MHFLIRGYQDWKFKNTFLLLLSLAIVFYFANTPFVKNFIVNVGSLGYLGTFITGMFFVSTFTVAPASVVLYYLAGVLSPYEVALLAGAGAVVGDYVIFRFLKDRVFKEVKPLFQRFGGSHLGHILRSRHFVWLMPVVGAIIIASPLPDEVGIGMMGMSRLKNWQFVVLTYALNAVGIFAIISVAKVISR